MEPTLSLLAVVVMALALATVPFGVPGVWFMTVVLLVGAVLGSVAWWTWVALAALTAMAELAEFWILKSMGSRYGGSRGAFWGAIVGGFAGIFVGLPVPLVGSVLAGFAGSFVGAALVTLAQTRSAGTAGRVGWGVLLARTASAVLKVGVGVVVLAVGAWELLVR